jgi:hypothetical protein
MDGFQEIYVSSYQQETTRGVSTERATLQPGEPQPCAAIGATVWYMLFTDTPSRVELSTAGSSFDTVLAVYALPGASEWPPKFSDLHNVACEDSGTGPASMALDTELYQQYFVRGARRFRTAHAHGALRSRLSAVQRQQPQRRMVGAAGGSVLCEHRGRDTRRR